MRSVSLVLDAKIKGMVTCILYDNRLYNKVASHKLKYV